VLLTGGQDGVVLLSNPADLKPYTKIETKIADILPTLAAPGAKDSNSLTCPIKNNYAKSIRSIFIDSTGKKMLVGTYGCQIHLLESDQGAEASGSKWGKEQVIMTGHYTPA
jgi:hypothetical protein